MSNIEYLIWRVPVNSYPNKCKKLVYTRVNGALHIENCKNYKKVITHQHIA